MQQQLVSPQLGVSEVHGEPWPLHASVEESFTGMLV